MKAPGIGLRTFSNGACVGGQKMTDRKNGMKTVLVTAFEPFGGEEENASERILDALPDETGDMRIEKAILPVVFRKAAEETLRKIAALKPDAVVLLGQAGGRDAITPERVAINLMDARIPDNEGRKPTDTPVLEDGPDAVFSTLPVKAMVRAMNSAGVPASLSYTAGTFVCNALMYEVLAVLRAAGNDTPCGFIHVPYLEKQVPAGTSPAISLEIAVRGIEEAIGCLSAPCGEHNEKAAFRGHKERDYRELPVCLETDQKTGEAEMVKIKLLAMDVDGTLTDGRMFIGNDGEIMKAFNGKDGYGIAHFLPEMGVVPVIITGRKSMIVEHRAHELHITEIHQGKSPKLPVLQEIAEKYGASPEECAFIGDDLNDVACLKYCGFTGCPSDAVDEVKDMVDYVCTKEGGRGAVREFIEEIRRRNEG